MNMIRIFCDFDGTVCQQDVGEQFFRAFAGKKAEEHVQDLLDGAITMQSWLTTLCNAIPRLTREEFLRYVDQFSVDQYFKPFVQFCTEHDMSITILSDGLNLYSERILFNADLTQIPLFANHAEIADEKLKISFPYTDAECNLCGNCKRNHILNASADEDIVIYVGDGYSDRCPIRYADFVFAKRQLIKHCQASNISYFEYNHFGDVQLKMEEILKRKRIRSRQEAVMARREVFVQG